ncbi:MAG: hypothetical protein GY856_01520 [bacterium]|nr:hypothetical protein [bacterium]
MKLPPDNRPLSHGPGSGHLAVLITVAVVLGGCLNHFQIHPRQPPSGLVTWNEEVVRGKLLIRIEGAHPAGEGPFPAVLVHPEAGHSAREMRGILHSLAFEGYLAVAADYRREKRGVFRSTLFTWKDPGDVTAAFDVLQAHPQVDRRRIGAMGYSQGGIYSLLIAAQSQQLLDSDHSVDELSESP